MVRLVSKFNDEDGNTCIEIVVKDENKITQEIIYTK